MLNGPFSPWPCFTQEEADAVSNVLLSNKVNAWTGDEGRKFEEEFAVFADAKHAIALANGTLALDLALYGLEIGPRHGGRNTDEVIVTCRSFVASASAIVNAGAKPIFADVDVNSQNITPDTVAGLITENTRAIICVHLAGWPCDMDGFKKLVAGKNIALIEDCAQAHGAKYKGQPVGCLGDVGAWSFCQDKIMTTGGEGGMVTCNDTQLWKRMWSYKDHGKNWDSVHSSDHDEGFRWLHDSFGTNWRLTEMQAAIGRIQLRRMVDWHERRGRNAQRMLEAFRPYSGLNGAIRLGENMSGEGESEGPAASAFEHAYYKFVVFVRPENLPGNQTRDGLIARFVGEGLPCFQGVCAEIYQEKSFRDAGFAPKSRLPVAKELGETCITFMVHPTLSEENLDHACEVIAKVLGDR